MNEVLDAVLAAVRDMDPVLRALTAGVAIMLETSFLVGLVIPGESIVLVAASGVRGAAEWVSLILIVILGSLVGESIGFALGRFFGHRIRASRIGKRVGEERWDTAERLLSRRGGMAIFISRFLPMLHSLVPLTVGMSQFSYWRFLKWTVPACTLWAAMYISVAASAAAGYEQLSGSLHIAGYLFVGVIALFLVALWAAKRMLTRSVQHDLTAAGPSSEAEAEKTGEPGDSEHRA